MGSGSLLAAHTIYRGYNCRGSLSSVLITKIRFRCLLALRKLVEGLSRSGISRNIRPKIPYLLTSVRTTQPPHAVITLQVIMASPYSIPTVKEQLLGLWGILILMLYTLVTSKRAGQPLVWVVRDGLLRVRMPNDFGVQQMPWPAQ